MELAKLKCPYNWIAFFNFREYKAVANLLINKRYDILSQLIKIWDPTIIAAT